MIEQKNLKKRDLPKLGHGGSIDPFATGLLVICVGRAVKLARYFLGATKSYEGLIKFGETTAPGDPTAPVTEKSEKLPENIAEISKIAEQLTKQPYLQEPPMYSAKKKNGKPLYELARAGIEVEREPKLCHLYNFKIHSYDKPFAKFSLLCSSGTYVRTLAQDLGKLLGTVAMLETLTRSASGAFKIDNSMTLDEIKNETLSGKNWADLRCWIPFDRMLDGYAKAEATDEETDSLSKGRQSTIFSILKRIETGSTSISGHESCVAIFNRSRLVAILRKNETNWELEKVFC